VFLEILGFVDQPREFVLMLAHTRYSDLVAERAGSSTAK
jgi:hypothetical protein